MENSNSKLVSLDALDKIAKELRRKALADISQQEEEIEKVRDMFGGKSFRYVLQEEYDNLSEEEKNDPSIVWSIIDAEEPVSKEYVDNINDSLQESINNIDDLKADKSEIPTKTSELENDSRFATINTMPIENSVKMVAHRGFSSKAPENTLVAYKLAGMRGYWGAECDIQETSDGYFILMHDDTVDRTTNGTGSVADMTLEQIKALTVKIKPGYYEPVPTLEEYLICCKEYNLVPVIEIKALINVANFIQIIRDYGMENKAVVISFSNEILINLRNLSNEIKIQTLTFVSIEHCLQYNFDIDIYYQDAWVTKENIKNAHNNNIEVNVFTVDNASDMNSLINRGVDYITTNTLNLKACEGNRLYNIEQTSLTITEKASLNLLSSMKLGHSDLEPIKLNEYMFTISERRSGEYVNTGTKSCRIVSNPIATLGCYHYKVEFDDTVCKLTLHPRNKANMQITDLGWFSTNGIYKLPGDTTHFYIYCAKADDSEIPFTDEEIDRIKSSIKITRVYNSSENDVVHIPSNIRYAADHPEPISTIGTNIGNDTNGPRCFTNTKYDVVSRYVKVNFDSSLIKLTIASASSTDKRLTDIGWLTDNNEYNLPIGASWFYMYFAPVDGTSFTDEQKLAITNATVTSIVVEEPLYQPRQDNTLNTEDKTIVGAINELESEVFDIAANVISMDAYKADKTYVDEQLSNITNNNITEAELDLLLEEIFGINSKNELTSVRLGNYQMKYDNVNDTLDFLYNGTIDEPMEEIIPLTWVVGNLSGTDGSETEQDSTLRSDFVTIEDNCDYSFYLDTSMEDPGGVRVYFYDADKAYISRTDGDVLLYTTGTDISIDIPTNAAYMRFKTNVDGTTTINNINSLFTLRKRKTAIVNNYVREGLSMYIDATRGSINDITGNNTITNHGVTHTSDNNYLNFVASESDYLDTDFVPNLTQWSAEVYFQYTSMPTASQAIFSWGVASDNNIRLAYSGSTSALTLQSNSGTNYPIISDSDEIVKPHHLIITKDNGTVITYLDGVKSVLVTDAAVQSPHDGTLNIGARYSPTKYFASMNLRTFRFYDGKVLSDEEALQNYNYEINRNIIKPTWIDGKSLLDNGSIVVNEQAVITDYIKIDNNYNYTINYTDKVTEVRLAYYDNNNTFILRGDYLTSGAVVEFPENTVYVRIKAEKVGITVNEVNDNIIFKKVLK